MAIYFEGVNVEMPGLTAGIVLHANSELEARAMFRKQRESYEITKVESPPESSVWD